jgi:hypothetical protein
MPGDGARAHGAASAAGHLCLLHGRARRARRVCERCEHERLVYNSCRNRQCPKCQALRQARWVAARMERALPVRHFHVVFTLPAMLRLLVRETESVLLDLLFAAASETILRLGNDPRRLSALVGVTAVLPRGFVMIRHFGLYAASNVNSRLAQARACIELSRHQPAEDLQQPAAPPVPTVPALDWRSLFHKLTGIDLAICPDCGGPMMDRPIVDTEPARAPPVLWS